MKTILYEVMYEGRKVMAVAIPERPGEMEVLLTKYGSITTWRRMWKEEVEIIRELGEVDWGAGWIQGVNYK